MKVILENNGKEDRWIKSGLLEKKKLKTVVYEVWVLDGSFHHQPCGAKKKKKAKWAPPQASVDVYGKRLPAPCPAGP